MGSYYTCLELVFSMGYVMESVPDIDPLTRTSPKVDLSKADNHEAIKSDSALELRDLVLFHITHSSVVLS